jgi:hypothetical protein
MFTFDVNYLTLQRYATTRSDKTVSANQNGFTLYDSNVLLLSQLQDTGSPYTRITLTTCYAANKTRLGTWGCQDSGYEGYPGCEAMSRATTGNGSLKEQIWHSPTAYVMLALGHFLHDKSHSDCHSTVLRHSTMGIYSEKGIVRRFRRCPNVTECTYATSLDSIAYYTPRLYGIAYCSYATNVYNMLLYWIL